jgi:hypothetical protein
MGRRVCSMSEGYGAVTKKKTVLEEEVAAPRVANECVMIGNIRNVYECR